MVTTNRGQKQPFSFGSRNQRNQSVTLDHVASDYLLDQFAMPAGEANYSTLKKHTLRPLD